LVIGGAWATVNVVVWILAIRHEEMTVRSNPAFHRVMWQMRVSFVLLPAIAGVVHRSVRILGMALTLAVVGWFVCELYGAWAYEAIGGGP